MGDLIRCVEMDGRDPDVYFLPGEAFAAGWRPAGGAAGGGRGPADEAGHSEAAELQETMRECADVYTDEATKLLLLRLACRRRLQPGRTRCQPCDPTTPTFRCGATARRGGSRGS